MPGEKSPALGWAQVSTTAFIGLVGVLFTLLTTHQQEKNRKTMMAVQLMSQREQAETSFRSEMFQTMLQGLLGPETAAPTERLAILRLFQHNFHDMFNGRAFFDVLEKDSINVDPDDREKFIKDLTSLAREIGGLQENLIESLTEKRFKTFTLPVNANTTIDIPQRSDKDDKDGEHHRLWIRLDSVMKNRVRVFVDFDFHVPTDTAPPPDTMTFSPDTVTFWVEYFDTPFTDNTLLMDGHRIAFILKYANTVVYPRQAMFKVIEFPANFILSGYRPSVKYVDELFAEIKQ